jgi:hypothetical protein
MARKRKRSSTFLLCEYAIRQYPLSDIKGFWAFDPKLDSRRLSLFTGYILLTFVFVQLIDIKSGNAEYQASNPTTKPRLACSLPNIVTNGILKEILTFVSK